MTAARLLIQRGDLPKDITGQAELAWQHVISLPTTAREAVDRGTAAAEQATRQAEQSYSSTAEGLREFNAKLFDIAQANTMAYMNFVSELTRVKGPIAAGLMRSVTGQQIGKSDPVRRAALAARKRPGA